VAACEALIKAGIDVIVHPILDGRDTSPKAARDSKLLRWLDEQADMRNLIRGTMGGRFYAMDRDNRWDRIQKAYDALATGQGLCHQTFESALQAAYAQDKTDEFVEPVVFDGYQGVKAGDGFFFINFRADRARQMMSALVDPDFTGFERTLLPFSATLGMTEYSGALAPFMTALFSKTPLADGLGETVSKQGKRQLRLSETEKYAHVTYFFNGGVEAPFDGEDRCMIPSPNVETYDLQPEMSAAEVTEKLQGAMQAQSHALIVVNYANPDMVGHTGVVPAIQKAAQTIDGILAQLEKAAIQNNCTLIITADHGNVETMVDETGAPHTAHTCNPVPFVVINGPANVELAATGTLADIAPTILHILDIPVPALMTGNCLIQ
jgi:2,3-bisphosphoglycerate-independent phosphoglycerate mutase